MEVHALDGRENTPGRVIPKTEIAIRRRSPVLVIARSVRDRMNHTERRDCRRVVDIYAVKNISNQPGTAAFLVITSH
jgi:hypothetical protein